MHPAYTLGGGEPEIRNQEVEIDPKITGRFDPAAGRRVEQQHVEALAILLLFVNLVDYGLLESSID